MKTFKLAAVTSALVISSVACAVPAFADTYVETVSQKVTYSAASLNTTEGAAALYSKLKTVAWRLCRDSQTMVIDCMRGAVDGAVKDIDSPNLTAMHEGRASSGLTAQR